MTKIKSMGLKKYRICKVSDIALRLSWMKNTSEYPGPNQYLYGNLKLSYFIHINLQRSESTIGFLSLLENRVYFYCVEFVVLNLCQSGGIGRRARLKLVWLRPCGFDSHLWYTSKAA